jgi:hypothetical protein
MLKSGTIHGYNRQNVNTQGRTSTMHSRDILRKVKGGLSWSDLLRSDGSRNDQAGEAGSFCHM